MTYITYHLGDLRVTLDFKAQAVAVTRDGGKSVSTEEIGDGVLIDRSASGSIVGVEVLGK